MLDSFLKSISNPGITAWEIGRHEIIPAKRPEIRDIPYSLDCRVQRILKSKFNGLYSHQWEAIEYSVTGEDVVLATSTASGKSLAYQSAVCHCLLNKPDSHGIFIFPLKALERDQLESFVSFSKGLGLSAAIYDGDTPDTERRKIRSRPPRVLITNPDMLHLSILGYPDSWRNFLSKLSFVVLDEVHTYKGIFGAHISQVLLRLERICAAFGAAFQYFTCSATISNPGSFISNLTGRAPKVVDQSGAGAAQRHFIFIRPFLSPYTVATRLFTMGLENGLKTIAFTKARKITELITSWVIEEADHLKNRISSYRAGFLPEERRAIEAKLFSGEMDGVISTSALEMGIDVGGLDLCVLVGYPGTIINTWQRGGRVGRGAKPSAIVMIAGNDALDQYFMNNPDDFFNRPCEEAVIDRHNEEVLKRHLPCAAAELPISEQEEWTKNRTVQGVLETLCVEGILTRRKKEGTWASNYPRPHRNVDLRGIGKSFGIFLEGTKKLLGSSAGIRTLKECHEGAVYLHRTQKYLITKLDLKRANIQARPERLNYYTRAVSEKDTEILGQPLRYQEYEGFKVREAKLKVTERIVAYEKRRSSGQDLIGTVDLELPPVIFNTVGFWIEIPEKIKDYIDKQNLHFMGGIHAIEHGMISLMPIHVLCDRDDIGGISVTNHDQVCGPAVFIYDGHPGGVGLSSRAFDKIMELVEQTLRLISDCKCLDGCPSCIHSPKCGSGNKPLDKLACEMILKGLLYPATNNSPKKRKKPNRTPIFPDLATPVEPKNTNMNTKTDHGAKKTLVEKRSKPSIAIKCEKVVSPKAEIDPRTRPIDHYVVFDLETKRLAQDVGGWKNISKMGLSVAVAYSNRLGYMTFFEDRVKDLVELFEASDLVIGFNHIGFDYKVLSAYTNFGFTNLNNLDMLNEIKKCLGYRVKLQNLAEITLGEGKSGDGLDAVKWFRDGRMDLVEAYCRDDVRITRDLYLFAVKNGFLLHRTQEGTVVRIPLNWPGPTDPTPDTGLYANP